MKKIDRQHRRSARTISVSPHQVEFLKSFDYQRGLSRGLYKLCLEAGYEKESEYAITKKSSPPICNGEDADQARGVEQII